jgi:hypothetical protein
LNVELQVFSIAYLEPAARQETVVGLLEGAVKKGRTRVQFKYPQFYP